MREHTYRRKPITRFFFLSAIVGIVTIAFWYNSKHQLSTILTNTYIPQASHFLSKEDEKKYTTLLRTFSQNIGIETRILYEQEPQEKQSNTLYIVIFQEKQKGYISYPPLMKESFSSEEKHSLNDSLSKVLSMENWKENLIPFLDNFSLILSSKYNI